MFAFVVFEVIFAVLLWLYFCHYIWVRGLWPLMAYVYLIVYLMSVFLDKKAMWQNILNFSVWLLAAVFGFTVKSFTRSACVLCWRLRPIISHWWQQEQQPFHCRYFQSEEDFSICKFLLIKSVLCSGFFGCFAFILFDVFFSRSLTFICGDCFGSLVRHFLITAVFSYSCFNWFR